MKVTFALVGAASLATGAFATVGDVVPAPMPVMNIALEEPLYGYADAMRAAQYKASEAKLAALKGMADASRASAANLIRQNAAKLEKASHMASFLEAQVAGPEMDAEAVAKIEAQLSQDCGEPCLKFFDALKSKMTSGSKAWAKDLTALMQQEYKQVQSVYKDQLETSKLAATFLKAKAHKSGLSTTATETALTKSTFNMVDTPCSGELCMLAEVVANKCNYGRVAALATYNAVNLAVHVYSVVINVLCLCFHMGPTSVCALKDIAPICMFPYTAYTGLYRMNQQIYESGVRGSTKMCSMIGDFRVASPM